jgi:hypothetical protein
MCLHTRASPSAEPVSPPKRRLAGGPKSTSGNPAAKLPVRFAGPSRSPGSRGPTPCRGVGA